MTPERRTANVVFQGLEAGLRMFRWVVVILLVLFLVGIPLLFGRRWRCDACGWSGRARDLDRPGKPVDGSREAPA